MMRQSRHTPSAKYANVAQRGGAYWVPEQAAAEAAAELKAARSSGTGPSGYRSSPSTATTEAYINSVEENTPCTYEIAICSDLVCSPGGPSPTGKPGAGPKGTASSGERSRGQAISTAHEDALQQFAVSSEGTAAPLAHPPLLQTLAVASSSSTKRHTETGAEVPAGAAGGTVSTEEQEELRERARAMFYHGYDAYMQHAYPEAELCPLSCTGGKFDLIKIPLVTLIDTLDTLVILGNHSEFRRAVNLVTTAMPDFRLDANVSVFETTIRVLGGLLSAHLMAIDPLLGIYVGEEPYDGRLLTLAVDLGERLLPAFETKTGIPYGTVNLQYGVPQGETKIASTAGAGSLLVEFQVLSHLSGQARFGEAAYAATRGLYQRKSALGLLGKHINTETGQWIEALAGVGSNADSFYEYLLKAYLLFRDKELFGMFSDTYRAIKRWVMVGERWFTEVDMFSGKLQRKRVENLDAFWPGVEAMLGFAGPGAEQLNTFYSVWQDLGFLPEEIEYSQWQAGKGAVNGLYPLRPELIESTYHQYRTTGDRTWLAAGRTFLQSVESNARTDCGYATVTDVNTMKLADTMPSFFLSETCKYLYLLFDEGNFVNHRPYIFSTEAHPFDAVQVHFGDLRRVAVNETLISAKEHVGESPQSENAALIPVVPGSLKEDDKQKSKDGRSAESQKNKKKKGKAQVATSIVDEVRRHHQALLQSLKSGAHAQVVPVQALQQLLQIQQQQRLPQMVPATQLQAEARSALLPLKCRRPQWWDPPVSYDALFLQEDNSNLRNEEFKGKLRAQVRKNSARRLQRPPKTSLLERSPIRLQQWPLPPQISHTSYVLMDLLEQLRTQALERPHINSSNTSHSTGNSTSLGVPRVPHISKLKWYENESLMFPNERCFASDQPSHKKAAAKKADSSSHPPSGSFLPGDQVEGAVKTVRVAMGPLGEFVINVYPEGFHIQSVLDGIEVEVSNVGRSVVLVREAMPSGDANVLMAESDRRTVTSCRVQVKEGGQAELSEETNSGRVLFDQPCSVANFGVAEKGESVEIAAERVLMPTNGPNYMCEDPRQAGQAGQQSAGSGWWRSMMRYLGGPDTEAAEGPSGSSMVSLASDSHGPSVAVVDRGDCLFEEKAINAQRAGADAVIVRNSEDAVFIMAGKRDAEDTEKPASNSNESGPTNKVEEEVAPFTVMLSKRDGDLLAGVLSAKGQQATGSEDADTNAADQTFSTATVHVTSSVEPALLQTAIMGSEVYPKVYLQRKLILVVGSGSWATLLAATKGEDWQLYLMAKEDVYLTHATLAPPHVALTKGKQRKTLPHHVLKDPLALFRHAVHRKCPRVVQTVVGRMAYV